VEQPRIIQLGRRKRLEQFFVNLYKINIASFTLVTFIIYICTTETIHLLTVLSLGMHSPPGPPYSLSCRNCLWLWFLISSTRRNKHEYCFWKSHFHVLLLWLLAWAHIFPLRSSHPAIWQWPCLYNLVQQNTSGSVRQWMCLVESTMVQPYLILKTFCSTVVNLKLCQVTHVCAVCMSLMNTVMYRLYYVWEITLGHRLTTDFHSDWQVDLVVCRPYIY
jgi:hypothetical protein